MSDNRQPPAGAYICDVILSMSGDFTASDVADEAGVSNDSAYRYLDYMLDSGSLCADYDKSVTQYRLSRFCGAKSSDASRVADELGVESFDDDLTKIAVLTQEVGEIYLIVRDDELPTEMADVILQSEIESYTEGDDQ